MKRDSLYYQIFKRYPGLLFELIDQPLPPQAHRYRFESIEVKETAFRIDGVFLPPEDAQPRIIFFAEVQFQKDPSLFHRFFTESLTYLYRNQGKYEDWYGVLIFASRSLEPTDQTTHRAFLNCDQVQRIYLNELGDSNQKPLGIQLLQLTIAPKRKMAAQAKQLIAQVNTELEDSLKSSIIEVITTIAVYKFSTLSREEVERMLDLAFEDSPLYKELQRDAKEDAKREAKQELRQEVRQEVKQEVRQEVKQEIVLRSISMGMSAEQVASLLAISVEEVRQMVEEQNQGPS